MLLPLGFGRVDSFLLDVKCFNNFPMPNVSIYNIPAYHICEPYPKECPQKTTVHGVYMIKIGCDRPVSTSKPHIYEQCYFGELELNWKRVAASSRPMLIVMCMYLSGLPMKLSKAGHYGIAGCGGHTNLYVAANNTS